MTSKNGQATNKQLVAALGPANVGFAVFVALVELGLLVLARFVGNVEEWPTTCALVLAAGFCGIPIGMLITPVDEKEGEIFSSVGKIVAAAASGWLLAKIDGAAASVFSYDNLDSLAVFRIAAVLSTLVLATCAVFVLRRYADWETISQLSGKKPKSDGSAQISAKPLDPAAGVLKEAVRSRVGDAEERR